MNILDLRTPDWHETPLSEDEILLGLREGSIPYGPKARQICEVFVTERRIVEVINFPVKE